MHVPIFGLNLPRIFQHAYINEEILGGLQGTRQVHIGPLALICRQQITVQSKVLLFLGAQRAVSTRSLRDASVLAHVAGLLLLQHINSRPAKLFQFLRPHPMVRHQAALIPAHAKVIHQKRAGGGRVGRGIE